MPARRTELPPRRPRWPLLTRSWSPTSPYAQATLDAAYASSLAQIPDGKAKTSGVAFGTLAADNLIAMRANDGRDAPVLLHPAAGPGRLAAHAPGFLPMAVHGWDASRRCWCAAALSSANRGPPPALTSCPVHPRLRRGQGARLGDLDRADAGADEHRAVLLRQRRSSSSTRRCETS